ncbi:MAG: hypothetical protein HY902_01580 [Deltaproteobacteria bacterium]|nr:hypothetical protein [Deltaproteobacteria bacterium]
MSAPLAFCPSLAPTLARRGAPLALLATLTASAAVAGEEAKPKGVELQVFLGDKPVGTEVFRSSKGSEANFFSTEAQLQDKVGKAAWKAFKQRAALQTAPDGTLQQYDRWIDVTGATQQSKLFNFQGKWRISVVDAAFEGKKPKPKVTDVKAANPTIVFDERVPSLVVLAAERADGKGEVEFVRVDDASSGKVHVATEHLSDAKGGKFTRTTLKGDKVDAWVLRDGNGALLAIKGMDNWRAVAKGAKVPADASLKPAEVPAKAAPLPAAGTPTTR